MSVKHQRKSLRAPLYSKVFLSDGHNLFQTQIINISTGGVLLDECPYNWHRDVQALFLIPKLPTLAQVGSRLLRFYRRDYLPHQLLQTKLVLLDEQAKHKGCAFKSLEQDHIKMIEDHLVMAKKNLTYALAMFESDDYSREQKLAALKVIGYEDLFATYSLGELRSHLLHDYQNMTEKL